MRLKKMTEFTSSASRLGLANGNNVTRISVHPKVKKILSSPTPNSTDHRNISLLTTIASHNDTSENWTKKKLVKQSKQIIRKSKERENLQSPVLSQSDRRGSSSSTSLSTPSASSSSKLSTAAPILKPISKSASVPSNLKEKSKNPDGFLKRSSSFLGKFTGAVKRKSGLPSKSKSSESLNKKCVSFSADTKSFSEGRPMKSKKTALHEVSIYKKGVLQDRNACEDNNSRIALNSQLDESESYGGHALLRAAQDADDGALKKIVGSMQRTGIISIDVNAVDSSGRSAASFLAGNGNTKVLEICLSLPGADVNLPDNEGNTPLHFAAQAGQTDCLNVLLRCPGIEVDSRNALGFTPLMKAALQGRTKCAKILLFAGANPTLRDQGRGLRAEQWARFCGRYMCAEVIERFARHKLLEKSSSCRWGSEPELAAKVLQGKLLPVPAAQAQQPASTGLRSKIRKVFRTSSNSEKTYSLVSQLTSAALCASSPVLPKSGDAPPGVKNLLKPLSVPQLRITLVAPQQDSLDKNGEKCNATDKSDSNNGVVKPPRVKKKAK